MKRLPPLGLLLILVLGLTLTFALHSTLALRWSVNAVSDYLPIKIEAGSLEGGLAGPIHVRQLKLELDGMTITAGTVDLDWWPGDLLRNQIDIKYLIVADLEVVQHSPDPDMRPAPAGSDRDSDLLRLPEIPVRLDLKSVSIDKLSWELQGNRQQILERFRGAVFWNSRELKVSAELLDRPDITLSQSEIRIGGGAPYPLGGTVNWRIRGLLASELVGQSRLRGFLAQPHTEHSLMEPVQASAELDADLGQPTLQLAGKLDARELNPQKLQANWPGQALSLLTSFSLDGDLLTASGKLKSDHLPDMDISLRTALGSGELQILALDVAGSDTPARLGATGKLALSPDMDSQLALDWEALDLMPGENGLRLRTTGKAALEGRPSKFRLQVNSRSQLDDYPPVELYVEASGTDDGLDISRLHAELLQGVADGGGRLDWGDGFHAQARIRATGLDPSAVLEVAGGSLDIKAALALDLSQSGARVGLELESLDGILAGEPVTGHGSLHMEPGHVQLRELELNLGTGTISASGNLGDEMDFRARIEHLEVGSWIPDLAGSYAAELTLSGSRQAPRVKGSLHARQPKFRDWQAEQLEAQLLLDLSDQSPSSISIQAGALRNGGQQLGNLDLNGEGVAASHLLQVKVSGAGLELDGQVRGAYRVEQGWQGSLSALRLRHDDYSPAPWNLTQAVDLDIDPPGFKLGELCMGQDAAVACMSGELVDDTGNMTLQLKSFPLSSFNPLLRDRAELTGVLNARAEAGFNPQGQVTGAVGLVLGPTTATWYHEDGDQSAIAVDRLTLSATGDEEGLRAITAADLGEGDRLNASLDLKRAKGPASDWPAQGKMTLSLGDLSRYDKLIPDLENLGGKLTTNLEISGSLNEPVTTGRLTLENLETQLPELGTRISQVTVNLEGGAETNLLTIQAKIGDGTAVLDGDFELLAGEPRAAFRLSGENLTLVDSPKLYLRASPDLRLKLEGAHLDIGGKLLVPRARIEPVDLGNAVRSSPDVVIADGSGSTERKTQLKVHTNVAMELGDQVTFDGFGLTARITGDLRVKDSPEKLTTARGALNIVDGKYKLYGMELNVERGQLLFAGGPIDTPGLSIRASRETDNVRVGVDVGGTLAEPTLTMFSSPAMPQSEIVAYLLTGKPMADLDSQTGQKASALGDALSLAGGSLLSGEIGSRVGLDQLALQSEGEPGDEELVLGKYLSPDLYVSYGISLYESFNTFRIRYQLNDRLSVRTETGINKSIDLFWSAER
jgi:translocation and assembly module TamB